MACAREPQLSAKRAARWLAVAPSDELLNGGRALGLCSVCRPSNEEYFGFNALPGVGTSSCDTGHCTGPVETSQLKLGLLRALCGLTRQLVRLDPECLTRRSSQVSIPQQLPQTRRKGRSSEDGSDTDSSSS